MGSLDERAFNALGVAMRWAADGRSLGLVSCGDGITGVYDPTREKARAAATKDLKFGAKQIALVYDGQHGGQPAGVCEAFDLQSGESLMVIHRYKKGFLGGKKQVGSVEKLSQQPEPLIVPFRPEDLGLVAESMNDTEGVVLTNVVSGSPADHAGLRSGDIVTFFGTWLVKEWGMLLEGTAELQGEVAAPVRYLRDGESCETTLMPPPTQRTP